MSNPTVAVLEQRLAALEGGVAAVATASGMDVMNVPEVAKITAAAGVPLVIDATFNTPWLFKPWLPPQNAQSDALV